MADDSHSHLATALEDSIHFYARGWPYDKTYEARSFMRHLTDDAR